MMIMLIDHVLPEYDESEYHKIEIRGNLKQVYRAVRHLDFSDSLLIRSLFRLRGLPAMLKGMDDLLAVGFVLVEEVPHEEFVLGLVGKFWNVTAKIQQVNGPGYRAFNSSGFAKLAWNFVVRETGPGVVKLSTETRVMCLDDRSRRRFRLYWFLVGRFSGLIRREMLRCVKRRIEFG